jgi:hypothetical protein
MIKFTVYVDGEVDYEGDSFEKAEFIYNTWLDLGYENVFLEESIKRVNKNER